MPDDVNSLFNGTSVTVTDNMVEAAIAAWNATESCAQPHLIVNRFERDQMRAAITAAILVYEGH